MQSPPTRDADRLIAFAQSVVRMPDVVLELRLQRLASIERKALALLLAHLAEFDRRRLHAERGQPSLFSYCVRILGYSEQAAYKRIQAARAARDFPVLLRALEAGEISLAAVVVLTPHLRAHGVEKLLNMARGKPIRDLERLVVGLAPRPDAPDCIRALPMAAPRPQDTQELEKPPPASWSVAPAASREHDGETTSLNTLQPRQTEPSTPRTPAEVLKPLSAARHLFRFTGSSALRAKYERARELLRAGWSRKGMEAVFESGLDALLDRIDPERRHSRRKTKTEHRRASGRDENGAAVAAQPGRSLDPRHIPLALRDIVWTRDGGRCTFVGKDGKRCPGTRGLEVDHVRPYALGGSSWDASNLRLMCRAHNLLLARRRFGTKASPARW